MNKLEKLIKIKLNLPDSTVVYKNKTVDWKTGAVNFSNEIRKNLTLIAPDAVYHFNNQPFILFFDLTTPNTQKDLKNIHKQIWCFDTAPIAIFIYTDELKIYNAFRYQKENDSLEKLEIDNYQKRFSFWELQSGNTWHWIQQQFYTKGEKNVISPYRVNQKLFDNIKYARKCLTEEIENKLNEKFANIIILRLIFCRYLIDREVKIDENFIYGKTLEDKKNCFNNLISEKYKLIKFFKYLQNRFNGNLFDTKNDPKFSQAHLILLSQIFSSNLPTRQMLLFDIFDFSIIPVEVISGIYESIIDKDKRKLNSAIYTPSFLVDYVLSQTIDNSNKNQSKILDPACGSGIFLVQAYRRMIEKELSFKEKISKEKLVSIAKNNLFGIDKDLNALNVAAFSIYIALLDYKKPKEIDKFRLPELIGENLFEADFLDEKASYNSVPVFRNKEFDFIIGNPPWGSKNYKEHVNYITKHDIPTSGFQIAQTFLARTKDFAKESNTICGLIVTSSSFYSLWAQKFRKYFFNNYYVDFFFDLSAARRMIFEKAINPGVIVIYRYAFKKSPKNNIVRHSTIKPNLFLENFKVLVIEKNDCKKILQHYVIEHEWMLKAALYGSIFDFHFLKRLNNFPLTIEKYIDNINENSTIIFKGDGIKKLTTNAFFKLSPQKREKIRPFIEISNIPIIETSSIKQYYSMVDDKNLPKEDDLNLKSGQRIELYEGERILLKARAKNESQPLISYVDRNSVYREKTSLGISTKKEINKLKLLYGLFISKLHSYYQFLTSTSWGIFYPEIMQEEYLHFPFAKVKNDETFIEFVNQFINHYKDYYSDEIRPQEPTFPAEIFKIINQIVNEAYNVTEIEKDLIDYVLDISRYQFQESKLQKFIRPPLDNELVKYAKIFYDHFSNIYNEEGEYFQIDIYKLKYFVAMNFKIVQQPPSPDSAIHFPTNNYDEEELLNLLGKNLSIDKISNDLYIQKDIKGFEEDSFYIIKPNEIKCWHRAIARLDLAEIMDDIILAESEQLTEPIL